MICEIARLAVSHSLGRLTQSRIQSHPSKRVMKSKNVTAKAALTLWTFWVQERIQSNSATGTSHTTPTEVVLFRRWMDNSDSWVSFVRILNLPSLSWSGEPFNQGDSWEIHSYTPSITLLYGDFPKIKVALPTPARAKWHASSHLQNPQLNDTSKRAHRTPLLCLV